MKCCGGAKVPSFQCEFQIFVYSHRESKVYFFAQIVASFYQLVQLNSNFVRLKFLRFNVTSKQFFSLFNTVDN
jgi:hypothetical protein